jgi:hypothetical protein
MASEVMAPDSKPGAYYVSVVKGSDYRLLLGPFVNDHAKALGMVDAVRRKAEELDPRACWYAFGSCRLDIDADKAPPSGILNDRFLEALSC